MMALDGIALPAGLVWTDEFESRQVSQTITRTLDGSLVVFYGAQTRGQPITLTSEPDAGWLTRAQVEALALRAASPGGVFFLELRRQRWRVMFRHHEAPAFQATPLVNLAYPTSSNFYLATLKLMTV